MTKRVLVWDPLQTGHHRIWLEILVETAPPGVDLTVPDWWDTGGSRRRTLRLLEGDAYSSIGHALEEDHFDVLLLPDLRPLLPSDALWHRMNVPALVAIDHGPDHVRLREEPLGSLGLRRSAAAFRHLVWRELLVRRQPLTIVSTNPDSVELGSRRLRSATRYMSMPIETLRPVQASRWPAVDQRLVLVGALQPRKGLASLVTALELLAPRLDQQGLEVLVAGRPSSSYRPEVHALVSRLGERGFRARFVDRYLGDDEYSAVVGTADVVVLPYDRFIGGSGIVGSLLGKRTSLVVSDYGWLGRFAAERGAYTFPNGDVAGLANAIFEALKERRPLRQGGTAFEPRDKAMKVVWDIVLTQ